MKAHLCGHNSMVNIYVDIIMVIVALTSLGFPLSCHYNRHYCFKSFGGCRLERPFNFSLPLAFLIRLDWQLSLDTLSLYVSLFS